MEDIIRKIIAGLNMCEKEQLRREGCTNSCFFDGEELTKEYTFNLLEKQKYFYINLGTCGVFMVLKADGEIYNIKAYGTPDLNKKLKANLGNIKDYIVFDNMRIEKIRYLHSKQYNYLR